MMNGKQGKIKSGILFGPLIFGLNGIPAAIFTDTMSCQTGEVLIGTIIGILALAVLWLLGAIFAAKLGSPFLMILAAISGLFEMVLIYYVVCDTVLSILIGAFATFTLILGIAMRPDR